MHDDSAPDAFFRLLTEHWPRILASVDDVTRETLERLASEEPADPFEVQDELEDLLLEALPPDHPVVEFMRQRLMLHGEAGSGLSLGEHQARWRRGLQVDLGAPSQTDKVQPEDPPGQAATRDLLAEVRRGLLLQLATYDSTAVRAWADRPDLIRLSADDGSTRWPVFQFRGQPAASADEPGEPDPLVVRTNSVLRAERDPWGAASWWAYPHACIGVAPVELLGGDRADVLPVLAGRLGED